MEKLSFISVPKKIWHLYHPIKRKLSSFEVWGMNMCYECLYHEINGEKKYEVNKGDNFHVEDDTYVYNKENIVYNEHRAKGWMYLGKNGTLMLEFRTPDGNIDELLICR